MLILHIAIKKFLKYYSDKLFYKEKRRNAIGYGVYPENLLFQRIKRLVLKKEANG